MDDVAYRNHFRRQVDFKSEPYIIKTLPAQKKLFRKANYTYIMKDKISS